MIRLFKPRPGTDTKAVLWLVLGLFVALFYTVRRVVTSLSIGGWATEVDLPVYNWVLDHQSPALVMAASILHWWGSSVGMTLTMLIITGLLCWWQRSAIPLLLIGFTALGSVLLTIILKRYTGLERPDGVPGGPAPPETYSFPSGHTLNAAALLGIAAYLAIVFGMQRYAYLISIVVGLFVVAMGASRIYLGHHWVSDVVVGLLIGAGWAAIVAIVHYYFMPIRPRSPRTNH